MVKAVTDNDGTRIPAGRGSAIEANLSRANPARLHALWPRGVTTDAPPWRGEELGEVLRHQLAASFGGRVAGAGEPAGTAGELLSVDDAAAAPPSLERLRQLKDWAKPNMTRDDGDVPREVAGVIYFAAILCALVRAGVRISRLDDERLRAGARWALGLPWLDGATAAVFRRGLAALGSDG